MGTHHPELGQATYHGGMEDKPAVTDAGDEERARRWSKLPDRVKLADTFDVQPVSNPPELPNPQDVERVRAMRYGAG